MLPASSLVSIANYVIIALHILKPFYVGNLIGAALVLLL